MKSLCLVASHDSRHRVCPNLVLMMKELGKHFEKVVLCTNSRPIDNIDEVRRVCSACFVPTGGRDFGKWTWALRDLGTDHVSGLERLGLVNDSCCIVNSMDATFRKAAASAWEFWGMTYSIEQKPHLQSYFLVADSRRACDDVVHFLLEHTDPTRYREDDKDAIVRDLEIGMSTFMMSKGHRLRAAFDWETCNLVHTPGNSHLKYDGWHNVSMLRWDALLAMSCPLLKKRLMPIDDQLRILETFVHPEFRHSAV